ncbi:MAG: hypothetical protein AAGD22_04575 [Verrucomicrobiota bacterium]
MRDLNPLFERIRLRYQKNYFDTIAGNFSREYNLTSTQEYNLQRYLERKTQQNAAKYGQVLTSDQATFEDLIRASRNFERDDGIDEFMENTLQGEARERFKTDRLAKKNRARPGRSLSQDRRASINSSTSTKTKRIRSSLSWHEAPGTTIP